MKITLYIIIIIGSLLIPLKKVDVAKLEPVEAAVVHKVDGKTEIYTDTGAWGIGDNAREALEELIRNTPEVVYLDTAKYLIVDEHSIAEIESLRTELKDSVQLCIWNCEGELQNAIKYFSVHEDLPKLKQWKQGDKLPEYICKKQ